MILLSVTIMMFHALFHLYQLIDREKLMYHMCKKNLFYLTKSGTLQESFPKMRCCLPLTRILSILEHKMSLLIFFHSEVYAFFTRQ